MENCQLGLKRPVIINQATDGAAPGELNDEKLAAAVGTLPGTGSHEGSQEDGDELLESSAEEEERGSPFDDKDRHSD